MEGVCGLVLIEDWDIIGVEFLPQKVALWNVLIFEQEICVLVAVQLNHQIHVLLLALDFEGKAVKKEASLFFPRLPVPFIVYYFHPLYFEAALDFQVNFQQAFLRKTPFLQSHFRKDELAECHEEIFQHHFIHLVLSQRESYSKRTIRGVLQQGEGEVCLQTLLGDDFLSP